MIDVGKYYNPVGATKRCASCGKIFDTATYVLRVGENLFHQECARKVAVKMIEEAAQF